MATPRESADSVARRRAGSSDLSARHRGARTRGRAASACRIVVEEASLTTWRCALRDSPGRPLTSMLFDPKLVPNGGDAVVAADSTPGSARKRASSSLSTCALRGMFVRSERCRGTHADARAALVVEADRLRGQTDEGFSEQGCAGEQHHGQRDLAGDDERAASGCGIGPGLVPIEARRSEESRSRSATAQRRRGASSRR